MGIPDHKRLEAIEDWLEGLKLIDEDDLARELAQMKSARARMNNLVAGALEKIEVWAIQWLKMVSEDSGMDIERHVNCFSTSFVLDQRRGQTEEINMLRSRLEEMEKLSSAGNGLLEKDMIRSVSHIPR